MKGILLAAVLVVGILLGFAVVPQFLGDSTAADSLCNQRLSGGGWNANLHLSEDVADGTRLVCERDGVNRTLTINVDVDIRSTETAS